VKWDAEIEAFRWNIHKKVLSILLNLVNLDFS